MDALLLAAFAAQTQEKTGRFADLGTGCGVVGLAFLKLQNMWSGFGLEREKTLVEAANHNAAREGQAFTARHGDCTSTQAMRTVRKELGPVDLVMSNPPWRLRGTGRLPASETRSAALFGDAATLSLFAAAAASLLKERGRYVCTAGIHRLPDMLEAVQRARLTPARLLFAHPNAEALASLFFLEARKGTGGQLAVEKPLFLYDSARQPHADALEFCPFLR